MSKYLILIFIILKFDISAQNEDETNVALEKLVSEKIVVGAAAGYSINGNIEWQSTSGYADLKTNKKFEINTITRTASIAKSMTAIAVIQLVEQSLIDLDAPIQDYIPDFPKQQNTQITTRHLLSHTSGIDGYKNANEAQNTSNYATLAEAVNIFKNRELRFEPGTRFSYSTYGYVVLGLIIEKVSGLSFEDYMKVNIWEKANMTNTGIDKFGNNITGKSSLYHRVKKGKIRAGKENNLSNRIPGGGFYTTLGDMFRFGHAVLNNTFISEQTLNLMRQHHSLEKEANAYGFGWYLYNPKPNEGAIIGHTGEQTGVSSQLFIIPSTKTVVIVLANTSGSLKEVSMLAGKLLGISQKKISKP